MRNCRSPGHGQRLLLLLLLAVALLCVESPWQDELVGSY
jgi:hypothetical protein